MIYRCIHGSTYWSRGLLARTKKRWKHQSVQLSSKWMTWNSKDGWTYGLHPKGGFLKWGHPPVLIFSKFSDPWNHPSSYWGSPVQVDEHVGLGQRSLLHAGGWGAILGRLVLWCFRPWVPRVLGDGFLGLSCFKTWDLHGSSPNIWRLLREKGFQPLDFGWTFWDNPRPISSLKTKFAALRGPPSLAGFKLGSFGHCFPILVGSSALIGLFSCGSTDMRGFWCVVGRLAVPFGWTTLEGDIDPTWSNICSWEKECVLWIKNAIASIHVMSPNGSAGTLRGFWCSYKHSPSLQRSCSRCCDSKLGPNWGQASRCWPTGFYGTSGSQWIIMK